MSGAVADVCQDFVARSKIPGMWLLGIVIHTAEHDVQNDKKGNE